MKAVKKYIKYQKIKLIDNKKSSQLHYFKPKGTKMPSDVVDVTLNT